VQIDIANAVAPLATQAQVQIDIANAVAPLATQAQVQIDIANAVAPLATQAQVKIDIANAVAPLAAQLNALQVQLNGMPTLAQIQALIVAVLLPDNAPAIAAVASATALAIANARVANNHSLNGVAYAVVLRADGTPPPNWPVGFARAGLRTGAIAVVISLLNDYGLAVPAGALNRRNKLALHIGTASL